MELCSSTTIGTQTSLSSIRLICSVCDPQVKGLKIAGWELTKAQEGFGIERSFKYHSQNGLTLDH
jgi:hypothetical protein